MWKKQKPPNKVKVGGVLDLPHELLVLPVGTFLIDKNKHLWHVDKDGSITHHLVGDTALIIMYAVDEFTSEFLMERFGPFTVGALKNE